MKDLEKEYKILMVASKINCQHFSEDLCHRKATKLIEKVKEDISAVATTNTPEISNLQSFQEIADL